MTRTISFLAGQDERPQAQTSFSGNSGQLPSIVAVPGAGDPQGQPDLESLAHLSISIARSLEMRRRARREA